MSADLFAIFGTPDKSPIEKELDERWNIPQGGPVIAVALKAQLSKSGSGDILFDADATEAEAEDDFGDFEDVDVEAANDQRLEPRPTQKHEVDIPSVASISQQVDLLDLGNDVAPEPVQEHRRFPSLEATNETSTTDVADEWGDFEDFTQEAHPERKPVVQSTLFRVPIQATPAEPAPSVSTRKNESWDDFEEWNSEQTTAENPTDDDASTSARHLSEIPSEPGPTNIPPPTILLQLLPDVFQSLQSQAKTSNSVSSIEETATSIITVFAVSARILAGRTLRYKRDVHLAQSTRIGPSTPGSRSGGMKLTTLNKSETLHSEREAAFVCDAWSRNTHIFAGVVSQCEHRRPWMNLNVNMSVRAGPGYGTLEAREACVLCGVRREERIAGVDFEADDVFGEYWTEWWGHTDCRDFWYTYRDMLEQR